MTRIMDRLASIALAAMAVALLVAFSAFAQKPKEPWEYLQEPAFKSAYMKALGPKSKTAVAREARRPRAAGQVHPGRWREATS